MTRLEQIRALIGEKGAKPFEPMPGRVMKEYIVVPPDVLSRAPALKSLVSRSLELTKTRKPKSRFRRSR